MDSEQNSNSFDYKPDNTATTVVAEQPAPEAATPTAPPPPPEDFSWTAAEFIEHPRTSSWYVMLFLATVLLAAAMYFVTKDYFATGVSVVVGIVIGVFAGHKPRQLQYTITETGMQIGQKDYDYSLFKSFSLMHEGSTSSINFLPLKRFMPPVTAYLTPEIEERAVDLLGDYLPYEERQLDSVDRLAHRLHF